jgi:hypothetical protein
MKSLRRNQVKTLIEKMLIERFEPARTAVISDLYNDRAYNLNHAMIMEANCLLRAKSRLQHGKLQARRGSRSDDVYRAGA